MGLCIRRNNMFRIELRTVRHPITKVLVYTVYRGGVRTSMPIRQPKEALDLYRATIAAAYRANTWADEIAIAEEQMAASK